MAAIKTTEAARKQSKISKSLRNLPGELVTTEVADEDKVHSNDAPHIIKGLVKRLIKEKAQGFKTPPGIVVKTAAQMRYMAVCHELKNKLPLTPKIVAIIRAKVLAARCAKAPSKIDFRVHHLWFPRHEISDASAYELRLGAAPRDLPQSLQGLNLNVDPLCWGEEVNDSLSAVCGPLKAHQAALQNIWNRKRLGLSAESNLILSPSVSLS